MNVVVTRVERSIAPNGKICFKYFGHRGGFLCALYFSLCDQEPFSRNRADHQNIFTQVTGSLSGDIWLDSKSQDCADGFRAQAFGWSGCLDAPSHIPVGGAKAVFISGEYEGTAVRSHIRGLPCAL